MNDRPYVPPAADASTSSTDNPAPTAAAVDPSTGDASLVQPALVAPPAATAWDVGGVKLETVGSEIVLALIADFDGDGQKDALAVVRPTAANRKPGSLTGELAFFHGSDGMAGSIAAGPPLGVQPSCVPTARLEKIGPKSAFAEIGSSCPNGAGSRAIYVVRLAAPAPSIAFDAVVTDPRDAPKLRLDVDATDRDKDGLDDVALRIGLEGAEPGARTGNLSAKLAFFDRPAGPSRDSEEPEASLRAIASQVTAKAAKAKDAASVLPMVQQMRALYRAMCAEGGAPRVTKIHGGSAVPCGSSKALEDANVAEVRALALQGDALRAFAAAAVAQSSPATKTAAKTTELTKLLGEVAPVVLANSARTLDVPVDAAHDDRPEWGPLAFEFTGKLIVRHGKDVVRLDPETGEGQPAEMIWRDEVISPDGKMRWIEAYSGCEGAPFRASFAPTGEGDMSDVVLPIPPRLGKTCSGRGERVATVPIAWGPRGLEAIVAGQPVLIKNDPAEATPLGAFTDEIPPPGSPRSHSTKAIALATGSGVLVRGRGGVDRWSMIHAPELEPYADLRQCTVSDDASRLACVRRGKVVVAVIP